MRLNHAVGILVAGTVIIGAQVGAAQDAKKPAAEPAAKSQKSGHSMTGCLEKGTKPNTFVLSKITAGEHKEAELVNAPASLNLAAHVGHKVQMTGTSVSPGAASKAEGNHGEEHPAGGHEHHMRPTAVKMISNSCL